MKEPCRSCEEKTKDLGGCRCQAYLLTQDAANADPVCDKSAHHEQVVRVVREAASRAANHPATLAPNEQPVTFRNDANSRRLTADAHATHAMPASLPPETPPPGRTRS
jgi:pyrroloquinoline quinone biosynthesis protein E